MVARIDPMVRSLRARAARSGPGSRAHAALAARARAVDLSDTLVLLRNAAGLARCAAARLPAGHPALPGAMDAALALEAALAASPVAARLTD